MSKYVFKLFMSLLLNRCHICEILWVQLYHINIGIVINTKTYTDLRRITQPPISSITYLSAVIHTRCAFVKKILSYTIQYLGINCSFPTQIWYKLYFQSIISSIPPLWTISYILNGPVMTRSNKIFSFVSMGFCFSSRRWKWVFK